MPYLASFILLILIGRFDPGKLISRIKSIMSSLDMPAAYMAATTAPTPVPETISGLISSASRALMYAILAMPCAPLPPKAIPSFLDIGLPFHQFFIKLLNKPRAMGLGTLIYTFVFIKLHCGDIFKSRPLKNLHRCLFKL